MAYVILQKFQADREERFKELEELFERDERGNYWNFGLKVWRR